MRREREKLFYFFLLFCDKIWNRNLNCIRRGGLLLQSVASWPSLRVVDCATFAISALQSAREMKLLQMAQVVEGKGRNCSAGMFKLKFGLGEWETKQTKIESWAICDDSNLMSRRDELFPLILSSGASCMSLERSASRHSLVAGCISLVNYWCLVRVRRKGLFLRSQPAGYSLFLLCLFSFCLFVFLLFPTSPVCPSKDGSSQMNRSDCEYKWLSQVKRRRSKMRSAQLQQAPVVDSSASPLSLLWVSLMLQRRGRRERSLHMQDLLQLNLHRLKMRERKRKSNSISRVESMAYVAIEMHTKVSLHLNFYANCIPRLVSCFVREWKVHLVWPDC